MTGVELETTRVLVYKMLAEKHGLHFRRGNDIIETCICKGRHQGLFSSAIVAKILVELNHVD